MNHLIIQTAFLGDLLLGLPLVKNLRQKFESDNLVLFCRKGLGESFIKLGLVDQVVEWDKNDSSTFNESAKKLKATDWQIVICPHQSFRSHFLVSQLNAKEKIGFKNWWNSLIFTKRIKRPMQYPEALRQLFLLSVIDEKFNKKWQNTEANLMNVNSLNTVDFLVHQDIPDWASMRIDDRLPAIETDEKKMAIAPGSVWATKRWDPIGFLEVAKHYESQGYKICLFGSSQEKSLCDDIASQLNSAVNFSGELNIYESLVELKSSSVFVGNDSGAMHMAAAVGCPIVSMFGPTTLELGYRPWSRNSMVVQNSLSCRPCGKHGADRCPIGTHECMKGLPSSSVKQAIDTVIARL